MITEFVPALITGEQTSVYLSVCMDRTEDLLFVMRCCSYFKWFPGREGCMLQFIRSKALRRRCSHSESLKAKVLVHCLLILLWLLLLFLLIIFFLGSISYDSKYWGKKKWKCGGFFMHFFPLRAIHTDVFGFLGNCCGAQLDWLHSPNDCWSRGQFQVVDISQVAPNKWH